MAESISGGRPLTPIEAFQEQQKADQAEKIDKIGLSYDPNNSVSHRDAKEETLLAAATLHAPEIPLPNQAATPTGDELIAMETQAKAAEVNFQITNSLEILKKTQPDLVTPELTSQIGQISNRLSVIESAPPGFMEDMSFLGDNLLMRAANQDLDPDMLNQIMSELQSNMDDNAVKFSEFEIKPQLADAQQRHDSNIQKIEEHIKQAEEAKKKESSSGGGFLSGLKAFFTAIIPPFAIYEAVIAINDKVSGSDSGLSIFSKNNSIGNAFKSASDEVEDAFEGFGNDTKRAFEKFGNDAKREFDQFANDAKVALEDFGEDTKSAFEEFGKDSKNAFEEFGKDTKNAFEEFGKDTKDAFEEFGKDTKNAFEGFGTDTKDAFEEFGKDTKNAFEEFGKDTKDAFEEFGSDAKKGLESFGSDTKNAFETFAKDAKEGLEGFGSDTKDAFESFAKKAREDLESFGTHTERAFEQFGNDAKEGFEDLGDMLVDGGQKVGQAFEDIREMTDVVAKGVASDMKEGWNTAGDTILKNIGIDPSSGANITASARPPSMEESPIPSGTLERADKVAASDTQVSATIQALDIGESAMTHQEMMKLLQQMKAADENEEKLAAAIAALESGDLESLKQAVQGLSGEEAIIGLLDNPESAGLAKTLLGVPGQTAQIQQDQMRQNGLVSRFNGA